MTFVLKASEKGQSSDKIGDDFSLIIVCYDKGKG